MSVRILVAYDGSTAAEAAIATAGRLFPGADGRLVTVVDVPPLAAGVRGLGPGPDAATAQRGIQELTREIMRAESELAARGVATADGAGSRWSRWSPGGKARRGRRSWRAPMPSLLT